MLGHSIKRASRGAGRLSRASLQQNSITSKREINSGLREAPTSSQASTSRPWLDKSKVLLSSFWQDASKRREYFSWLGEELGYKKPEDWYNIKKTDFTMRGGASLLINFFDGSPSKAVKTMFPDHVWLEWNFSSVPLNFWESKENQRRFFEWLKGKLGYQSMEDWYKLSLNDITAKGKGPLQQYNNSPSAALKAIYPAHHWQEWRFGKVSKGFWENKTNQLEFIEWSGKRLGVKNLDDWYQVKSRDFVAVGGGGVLMQHKDSLSNALEALYPQHSWAAFKFLKSPQGFWNTPKNVKDFIALLAEKYEIGDSNLDAWYRVSNKNIVELGGAGLLSKYGSLAAPLSMVYPQVKWDEEKFAAKNKKADQRLLLLQVKEMFPNHEIIEDYKHPSLQGEGRKVELDVWIPDLKLAFEYQGEQHYKDIVDGGFWSNEERSRVDEAKAEMCKKAVGSVVPYLTLHFQGVTLIPIPFWWDKDLASLIATVAQHRADLVPSDRIPPKSKPIAAEPPGSRRRGGTNVTRMDPNAFLKAREYYDGYIDPTGYWMSEKLDGVRCYWNGERLFSKNGNEIFAPESFTNMLPEKFPLDGELWGGKGNFEQTCTAVIRTKPRNDTSWEDLWQDIGYHIFDAPEAQGPFEARLEAAKKIVSERANPKLSIVPMEKCRDADHLRKVLGEVATKGGEGVMLREPGCEYKSGRSKTLLKVKYHREDEVRYVERNEEGRNLICEARSGEKCVVKCSPYDFENPPEVGAIVTVRHSGHHASGKPKFPFFLRIRKDVTWDDILREER